MDSVLLTAACILALIAAVVSVITLIKVSKRDASGAVGALRRDMQEQQSRLRTELGGTVDSSMRTLGQILSDNARTSAQAQQERIAALERGLIARQEQQHLQSAAASQSMEQRLKTFSVETEQKLSDIREVMERRLTAIQRDNNQKLDEMRVIVDEKLQKTINDRMTQSFMLVNERLEQVYKGLGEMQSLASGVGDLKKVLTNVKTRGTLGEIQLGAILTDILTPEQYVTNAVTRPGGRDPVEYAIKLPGDGQTPVLLPIDSKFPMEPYSALMDAYETGDKALVAEAQKQLGIRLSGFAKDVHEKYIAPPDTTDFAIIFLPTEGLYAEAVKMGLVTQLISKYRVNIAGPSTMAALLNSVQMGFRTVAIQKRSAEVYRALASFKAEFDKFEDALRTTQKQMDTVQTSLTRLITTRTNQIRRSLKFITGEETTGELAAAADEADDNISDK